MMKSLLAILTLVFLTSCVSKQEPVSQRNNPVKASESIKIVFTSPEEIYLMTNNLGQTKPSYDHIQTAKNHCALDKKNAYILLKKANPIKYWSFEAWDGSNKWAASKKDTYETYYIKNNGTYIGYRFICANSKEEALMMPRSYVAVQDPKYNLFMVSLGIEEAIEFKRIQSKQEIAENKKKELERKKLKAKLKEEKQKKFMADLDRLYGKECTGGAFKKKLKKGTTEFNNCLLDKDNEAKLKAKAERDLLEKKNAELAKKQVELNKKLAAMNPKERHAYNCSETFKFRKGTEKFNDCVFKLYTAELDLQKLELEKQVAEAKIKAAANEQAKAEAIAKAQIASARAAKRSSDLNNSIQLMKLGSSLLGGSTSSSSSSNSFDINNRTRTTCRVVGGFLNCY